MTPLEEFKNYPFDWEKLHSSHKGKVYRTYVKEVLYSEKCIKPVLEYLLKDHSASQTALIIGEVLGCRWTAGAVIHLAKRLGIKTHSWSEAARLPECRQLHNKTNTERYGAVNPFCRDTITYEKKLNTVKRKYGVDNIRKSKEFQETRKKSMLKKYGVTSAVFLPTYERCTGRRSKLQKTVEQMLTELHQNFQYEVPNRFQTFNEELHREYNPIVDILIEDKKTVIEVYGDMWHANPEKYQPSDIIPRWDGNVTANHVWKLDKARTTQIESFGYKVIVLWETDIRYKKDTVLQTLKKELNIN